MTEDERRAFMAAAVELVSPAEHERLRELLQAAPTEDHREALQAALVLLGKYRQDLEATRAHVTHLLNQLGSVTTCRGENCGERIVWVKQRNRKSVPYELTGTPHLPICPDADSFRNRVTKGSNL